MAEYEFFEKINQYIDGDISLEQLEDWYVPRLPTLIDDEDSAESNLVASLELGLAELSSGVQSENELKEYLSEALSEVQVELRPIFLDPRDESIRWITGSSNETPNILSPMIFEGEPVPT